MVLVGCLGISLATSANEELRGTDLSELVRVADVIVVAKVERIVICGARNIGLGKEALPLKGLPVAVATVERSYRGSRKGERLAIPAFGTWPSDATKVVANTTAIFFLERKDRRIWESVFRGLYPDFDIAISKALGTVPILWVARSGQGQMPVRYRKGSPYILATKFLAEHPMLDHVSSRLVAIPKKLNFLPVPESKLETDRRKHIAKMGVRYVDGVVNFKEVEREIARLLAIRNRETYRRHAQ